MKIPHPRFPVLAGGVLLAVATVALQGCGRGVEGGATDNPLAPGRPGTGNGVVEIAPQPTSIPESPQVGGTKMQVPEGITGSGGTTAVPGQLQGSESVRRAPGSGLDGGLEDRPVTAAGASGAPGDSAPAR